MADPLDDLLRSCCVSVDGRGTGFFVAPRRVVTCRHVVGDQVRVGDEIDLVAALTHHTCRAWITHLFPDDDLAILDTETEGESAVMLGPSEEELCGEERMLIVGYPQYQQSLRELGGIFVVYDGSTDAVGKRRLQFRENQVVPGFSGSPLLNLHTGRVVGIVTETRGRTAALGGWAVPAETIVTRLSECGVEIGASAANARSWNVALETRQEQLGTSIQFRQPELRKFNFGSSNLLSLGSRITQFLGRHTEMKTLDDFLESPEPFSWMLMTGPGGAGKSRLALELCLKHSDSWRAGFVTRHDVDDSKFWREWRPSRPTLLMVDYAGAVGDAVGEMIRSLRSRKLSPSFSVRVLLIEREIRKDLPLAGAKSVDWFQRFVGKGISEREATLAAQFPFPNAPEFAIGALSEDENWEIVRQIAPDRSTTSDRELALRRLREIDPECRALFAIFLAQSPHATNKVEIVRDMLWRERQRRWEPAGATEGDLMLLACATLCGGAARSLFAGQSQRLDAILQGFSASRYEAVSGKSAKSSLASLEPDIFGELYVLDWLSGADDADTVSILTAAWSANAQGTASFIFRAVPEFTQHKALGSLLKPPPGPLQTKYLWGSVLVDLMRAMPESYQALGALMYDEVKAAAAGHAGDGELYELHCRAALNLMLICERGGQFDQVASLETELEGLITKHPDQRWAKSMRARLLGQRIIRITQAIEAELALPLQRAPQTFVGARARMENAQKIFDELVSLSRRGASNADFQIQYAGAAFHLILGYTKPGHVFSRLSAPASVFVRKDVLDQLRRAEKI